MEKKRKDGRYARKVVTGRYPDGRIRYRTIYADTKKELAQKVFNFEKEQELGINLNADSIVFSMLAKTWLETLIGGLAPGTARSYTTIVKKHLIPELGGYRVKELKPVFLQMLLNSMATKGYKTKTIKEVKNVATAIMEFALDNDYVFKNPFKRVKLPKGERSTKRNALSPHQQGIILATYEGHKMGLPALIMMMCGLRRGELLALTWNDIDLTRNVITVDKAVAIDHNQTSVKAPKSEAGNRRIPIPETLRPILKERKKSAQSEMVCPSVKGKRMSECSFRRAWDSYMYYLNKRCGGKGWKRAKKMHIAFPEITPHMLRHTYATLLYNAGVDVKNAQRYLGHADVLTTLRIYTHLSQEKADYADDVYDSYLSDKVKTLLEDTNRVFALHGKDLKSSNKRQAQLFKTSIIK